MLVYLTMQHIQGISRYQLQLSSLEEDNPVRFIDAFVNSINLEKIGFIPRVLKTEGRRLHFCTNQIIPNRFIK
jgi:hypothetical protein